jgi:hypothetical protein
MIRNAPYWFFEECIPYGKEGRRMVIAFGERSGEGLVNYGPFRVRSQIPGLPPISLPVTVSFDTYTITADSVTVDSKAHRLKAEGFVSVTAGSLAETTNSHLIIMPLADSQPSIAPCQSIR